MTGTIYHQNVAVKTKPLKHTSNAEFIRISPHGLYWFLGRFEDYVNSMCRYNERRPATLTELQIAYVNEVYAPAKAVLHPLPLTGKKKNKVTVALRNKISALASEMKRLDLNLVQVKLPKQLRVTVVSFIDSATMFCEAFQFIDSLLVKIPNRPADFELKEQVMVIWGKYQKKHGPDTFPTYPAFDKQLVGKRKNGYAFRLSARGYKNYKDQWLRGTFWWYIQPAQH
jgi:hypothetical protein